MMRRDDGLGALAGVGLAVGAVLIAAVWFTTGCLQVHLLGGRSISINQYAGNGPAAAETLMEADSETSDLLKDLVHDVEVPVDARQVPALPVGGGDDGSDGGPSDRSPGSQSGGQADGEDPRADQNENPVGSFRYKPKSENDGRLVALFPASMDVVAASFNGEAGRDTGRSNGNRCTFRWSKQGSQYAPGPMTATLRDGRTASWNITAPGRDQGFSGGPVMSGGGEDQADNDAEGDAVRVLYEPPHLVFPDAIAVRRVALHIDGRAAQTGRAVPVAENVAAVPAEWLGQPALLAQVHTAQEEALYEMTFDPREGWLRPFTVIYTPGWMKWTAAVPQNGYVPTAEQDPQRQSTKWRWQG